MSEERQAMARILQFDQPGRFFHKRAQRQIEKFKYLEALTSLRLAAEREPGEAEYLMDMAEIYTEMCLYGESNQILFELMSKGMPMSECYFGLGCNFMGMSEHAKARDSFQTYLSLDPSGEYADEAAELLEMLVDSEDEPSENKTAAKLIQTGRHHLDAGEYDLAASCFARALEHDEKNVSARNSYALALGCQKKTAEAAEQTLRALEVSPSDVFANCNLALFLSQQGRETEAEEVVTRLLRMEPYAAEDMSKLCLTLSELKCFDRALELAKGIEQAQPYDKKNLHHTAALLYNTGRYADAAKYWQRILRIEPANTVARYYAELAQHAEAHGARVPRVPFQFQVPHKEMLRRIRFINRLAKDGIPALKDRWDSDPGFRALLCWGLELSDASIRRALYHLISVFKDAEGERVLRAALTRQGETDANKREVLGMLKQMGAAEPYIAMLDGAIVEVRVNVLGSLQNKLPEGLEAILQTAAHIFPQRHSENVMQEAVRLWAAFTSLRQEDLPLVRKPEVWVAALEYAALVSQGERVRARDVAALWEVSAQSVSRRAREILECAALWEQMRE